MWTFKIYNREMEVAATVTTDDISAGERETAQRIARAHAAPDCYHYRIIGPDGRGSGLTRLVPPEPTRIAWNAR